MKNPPHPGHSIKDACLDALGLSVTDAAKVLGVARAIRLARPGWLRVQAAYGLSQARQREDDIKVKRYEPQLTR